MMHFHKFLVLLHHLLSKVSLLMLLMLLDPLAMPSDLISLSSGWTASPGDLSPQHLLKPHSSSSSSSLSLITAVSGAKYWSRLAPLPTDMILGSTCRSTLQCLLFVANSNCDWDNRVCTCQPYHVQLNNSMCLPASLLGYGCTLDEQCTLKVPNSYCNRDDGTCACKSNFLAHRKDRCLPPAKLDGYCLNDQQCSLTGDKYSYCKYIIPKVYGKCRCPIGYKMHNFTQCLPTLGKKCYRDGDCEAATANSFCKPPAFRSTGREALCACSTGYRPSLNRTVCEETDLVKASSDIVAAPFTPTATFTPASTPVTPSTSTTLAKTTSTTTTTTSTTTTTATPSTEDATTRPPVTSTESTTATRETSEVPLSSTTAIVTSTNSPLVMLGGGASPVMSRLPGSSTPPPEEKKQSLSSAPQPHLNVSEATSEIALVSLGKSCRSSLECQVRDPYSVCLNGVCECSSPSARCSSRNTGCHNDTFQCRNGQCISWYFVCDKNKNCDDGSDEEHCNERGCPKEAFQCDDGTCLSRSAVCNGRWECPDGSDEARCYKGIACDEKSFRCQSGQCLPQYAFCNAVTDCVDGSDEIDAICEHSQVCPKGTFQCANSRCRSTAILCSGVDGCGDNSDEDRCEVCYCENPMKTRFTSRSKFFTWRF